MRVIEEHGKESGTQPLAEIERGGCRYPVFGHFSPRFERVFEAFKTNFAQEEETGAAAAIILDGRLVVDLWGGYADSACTKVWRRDTIVNMMSVAKGFAATSVHILLDRGVIGLDDRVADHWPEFAAAGKEKLPIRYLLDHRAGLPVIEPAPPGLSIYDWDGMTRALASQRPLWEPGTKSGYHIVTQGFLLGELVRRVTGQSLGTFVREEISRPLGLDYQIGLNAEEQTRCAEFIPAMKGTILDRAALDPSTLLARSWAQVPADVDLNSREWRECEFPSGNGHGTARAVAKFYGALARGGEIDGVRLLGPESIERAIMEQHEMTEIVMGRTYHQALGVIRNSPPTVWMGPNPAAFGHHGVGGSIGMADPDSRMSFAYAMNRMHTRIDNGPRAGRLIESVYKCI